MRAVNVFRPEVYEGLEGAFHEWQESSGGGTPLPGHDLRGATVTAAWTGPLRLFASRGWHDLIAGAVGVTDATGHVNLGLHHHEPYCDPGFPHTDLNPAWFPRRSRGGVVLADPARVEYTTGAVHDEDARPVRVARAVAVLYYLANPRWSPEHGGQTGLYRSGRDAPDEAISEVPPHSNSLLAFECTPWSLHGFVGGGSASRNSLVHWLHRPIAQAEQRWGQDAILGYGGRP